MSVQVGVFLPGPWQDEWRPMSRVGRSESGKEIAALSL